jgi:hypothetical protein
MAAMGGYEQYKLDAKRFILWLIVTARAYGHTIRDSTAVLLEAARNQPSQRTKGKEKKAAPSIATLSASRLRYTISTETMELAEYIGDQEMTASMPKFVWYSYRRAIKTRQKYAERYANDELTDRESDDGHIYFL